MRVVRYRTQVDPDIKYSPYQFRTEVAIYLADPNGWEGHGYRFQEAENGVLIRLSSPKTIGTICKDSDLSCAELGGKNMYVNASRWMKGSVASKLPLEEYRQYIVTHEMGHILGFDHVGCPGRGLAAPLMMQQTLGLKGCRPNTILTKQDVK